MEDVITPHYNDQLRDLAEQGLSDEVALQMLLMRLGTRPFTAICLMRRSRGLAHTPPASEALKASSHALLAHTRHVHRFYTHTRHYDTAKMWRYCGRIVATGHGIRDGGVRKQVLVSPSPERTPSPAAIKYSRDVAMVEDTKLLVGGALAAALVNCHPVEDHTR